MLSKNVYLIVHIGEMTAFQFTGLVNLKDALSRLSFLRRFLRTARSFAIAVIVQIFIFFLVLLFFVILLPILVKFIVVKVNSEYILCLLERAEN